MNKTKILISIILFSFLKVASAYENETTNNEFHLGLGLGPTYASLGIQLGYDYNGTMPFIAGNYLPDEDGEWFGTFAFGIISDLIILKDKPMRVSLGYGTTSLSVSTHDGVLTDKNTFLGFHYYFDRKYKGWEVGTGVTFSDSDNLINKLSFSLGYTW